MEWEAKKGVEKQQEEGGKEGQEKEDLKSKLYDMPKQRKRENWICIKLIGPEKITKKAKTKYLAKDAVGAYCTQCEQCIPFSVSNPSNVSRHMDSVHSDFIQHYRETEERNKIKGGFGLSTITHHLPTKAKQQERMASDDGQESFFNSVVTQLIECRLFLAEQFNSLFTGLDSSLMWSSLFDRRFASCEHMIGLEKQNALHLVREEIELIYFAQETSRVAHGINEVINSESEECSSNSDDDQFTLGLGLNKASKRRAAADALDSPQSIQARKREQLKMEIRLELEDYLRYAASIAEDITDPIAWWKERREKFPKVALGARKWLSVCTTSTPSKRVFSICGVVDTARRNCLNGNSITAQVFIHNNLSKLDVDIHYLSTLLH